jgi:hypothetical protein
VTVNERLGEADPKQGIRDEVDRIAREAGRNGRAQFKRGRLWSFLHLALGVPAVILAAVASSVLLADWADAWVPGLLALAAAVLMGVVLGLSPSRRARHAQDAGNDFLSLQDEAQRFRRLDLPDVGVEEARRELQQLVMRSDELAHKAPAPVQLREEEPPEERRAA